MKKLHYFIVTTDFAYLDKCRANMVAFVTKQKHHIQCNNEVFLMTTLAVFFIFN